jgi:histidinol-phosphate aminotransferase
VLDEAYIEFAPPGSSRLRDVRQYYNLVVLRTFSKWAALAGLRVGYGAFPESLIPHLWKIKQPYNVSVAASTAAITSLEHSDELQAIGRKIVSERERLFGMLQTVPYLEPYSSQANFILCRVVDREAGHLKEALAQRGILVRYFDSPRLRQYIRISVGKPSHSDALISALREME